MAQLVEVRFKGTRKGFYRFDGRDSDRLRLEDPVVVVAERGLDFGRVSATGDTAVSKCGGACRSCSTGDAVAEGATGRLVLEVEGAGHFGEPGAVSPLDAALARASAGSDAMPEGAVAVLDSGIVDFGPEPDEPATEYPQPDVTPEYLASLPKIVRRASKDDIAKANGLRRSEEGDRITIIAKVREHKLDMKVSDVEWQFDRSRLVVYFSAEQRVDFRTLVKELATSFRTRLELRQIGVRDEAARLGGVGRCGKEFCCSTWLTDLSPINLSLAKDQHLSLNPQQISGGCGRLLCCLRYEHEFYVASRKRFPKDGKTLYTLRGKERVVAVDIFRERVFLRSDEHGPRIVQLVELQDEQAQATAAGIGPENPVGIVPVANVAPGRMSPVQRAAEQAAAEAEANGEAPLPRREQGAPPERGPRAERGPRGARQERGPRADRPAQERGAGGERSGPERGPRNEGSQQERGSRGERPSQGRGSRNDSQQRGPRHDRPRQERGPQGGAPTQPNERADRPPRETSSSAESTVTAPGSAERTGPRRKKRRNKPRDGQREAPRDSAEPSARPASDASDAGAAASANNSETSGPKRARRNRRRGRGPRPDGSSSSES